ncbi:MAG: glycosyltransferase, partial [Methanobacteriota archaeon]
HDLDTLPVGVRLKEATGKPLVYDCHEVFGYMIEADVPRPVVEYVFRLERRLAPRADRAIAVNDMVKEYIDRASGHPAVVVRNVHEEILDVYRPPPEGSFTILYLGTLHSSRFILPAIEAMANLPGARLRIGGSKQLTPLVEAACARRRNATFLGLVPSDRVLPMTVDAHAVLCMFDPAHRINQVGLPNKIFEAMAAGRPSLVAAGLRMTDLVVKEACGLAVEYTKAGYIQAVERLARDAGLAEQLGKNGLAAAKREYNWHTEKRKLLALYEGLPGVA